MDLQTVFMVFGVLAAVVIFQLLYPKRPEFFLHRLSESFATQRRAPDYVFRNESFFVRSALEKGRLDAFFPWRYANFDVCVDDDGVWMSFVGPDATQCAPSLLVPWNRIRFVRHWSSHSYFTFLAKRPVGITVRQELGEAIARYLPQRPQ